jgi:hypothetical protein
LQQGQRCIVEVFGHHVDELTITTET